VEDLVDTGIFNVLTPGTVIDVGYIPRSKQKSACGSKSTRSKSSNKVRVFYPPGHPMYHVD
jgi:hypothetical protein